MGAALVVLVAVGILGGGFVALRPLLLRLASRAGGATVPAEWPGLLSQAVPATRALNDDQRARLLRGAQNLIETVRWQGCGGLVLTAEMQLVIAAQACLVSLELPGDPYPRLRSILVYPETFVPRRTRDLRKWLPADEAARPELGEAWSDGTIVLAWDSAREGARSPGDGRNVVYHEFAHEVAYEHRLTTRDMERAYTPAVADPDGWARVLDGSYRRLCDRLERDEPVVLDRYAATNPDEFFAVATEVFFEQPRALRSSEPELYEQLATLYRQDPAALSGS